MKEKKTPAVKDWNCFHCSLFYSLHYSRPKLISKLLTFWMSGLFFFQFWGSKSIELCAKMQIFFQFGQQKKNMYWARLRFWVIEREVKLR